MKPLFTAICCAIFFHSFSLIAQIYPKREKKLFEIVFRQIENTHYQPAIINNDFSKNVFNDYLNRLDPDKIFFTNTDYQDFKEFETKLDDYFTKKDLTFFYFSYDRIIKRMWEVKEYFS